MRPKSSRPRCTPTALALALALLASGRLEAGMVYLALGDSVTFGQDPSTPASVMPSHGDQGFVRPFADFLASMNGGIRPSVLNLAIGGELSTSFATGMTPPGRIRNPEWNLNYPDVATPQEQRMISSIAAIHAAGDSVGYASFFIGGNDLFTLIGTPEFQAATPAEQQAMLAQVIGAVQDRYLAVLTELRILAPEARILLPGYYNTFPSSTPEHAFFDSILAAFNPLVAADAAAFGATYVDFYTAIAGRELELTNIASGDIHPNQAGYAVLAGALEQAVAPEPGSLASLASGGTVGLLWAAARRRSGPRRAAA